MPNRPDEVPGLRAAISIVEHLSAQQRRAGDEKGASVLEAALVIIRTRIRQEQAAAAAAFGDHDDELTERVHVAICAKCGGPATCKLCGGRLD